MQTSPDFSGLRFNGDGLVPAIVQQDETHRVLMMAWVNREALERTLETGFMHYWSRSRGKLWFKGETSGHRQEVVAWYKDCDGDTLLFTVRQHGGACHTGYESCFFQRLHRDGSNSPIEEEPLFDAGDVYQTAGHQSGPDAGEV